MIYVFDLELCVVFDDYYVLCLWLCMFICCNFIEGEICNCLCSEFDIILFCFDFMVQLQCVFEGMKMGELLCYMMVINGNIIGIIDQLEKEGLVVCIKVEFDWCSFVLYFILLGCKIFVCMVKVYEFWVMGMFGDMLQVSCNDLYQVLGDFKQQVVVYCLFMD